MSSRTSSEGETGALTVVGNSPALKVEGDASRRLSEVSISPLEVGPGQKGAAFDVVSVEARATAFADGTVVRSWTKTEQRVEVVAPEGNQVLPEQVAMHSPVLGVLAGSSETARLLKLDNDDDYTDDDFDDEDEHDLDLDDEEDEEEPSAGPRLLSAGPRPDPTPAISTSWNPPFTTLRVGSTTVTVPDINAIHTQLGELVASAEAHRRVARDALRLVEPLAQRAMTLNYGARPDAKALASLREEARVTAAEPLRRAALARQAVAVELEHGQRISQRATGASKVKDRLDALVQAATEARESSLEAERLLKAIEDAAG